MKHRGTDASWGARWLAALGDAGWGAALKRGAAYSREGLAAGLQVRPGQLAATVPQPGSRSYTPRLAVRPWHAAEWARAAETLLTTPALASALAAGDWPPAVLPALTAAGLALLPGADDLAADCACGARPPCRHVAALCYLFAEALESDPWLLPLLRGRDRAALAQTLAAARARLVPEESTPPPPEEPAPLPAARQGPVPPDSPPRAGPEGEQAAPTFWDVGGALEGFYAEIAAPAQAAPLLRQLGPPPFWTPAAAFLGHLEPVYQAVTAAVLRLALGEEDMV